MRREGRMARRGQGFLQGNEWGKIREKTKGTRGKVKAVVEGGISSRERNVSEGG